MPNGIIDSVPPAREKTPLENVDDYLEREAGSHIEVPEPGFRSVTNLKEIVAISSPAENGTIGVEQILLQVIRNKSDAYGVVAVRTASVAALVLVKLGDGNNRATIVGKIEPGEAVVVSRNTDGGGIETQFQVETDGVEELIVTDQGSENGTRVFTNLKPGIVRSGKMNHATIRAQRDSTSRRRGTFEPPIENPFNNNLALWAPPSSLVKEVILG